VLRDIKGKVKLILKAMPAHFAHIIRCCAVASAVAPPHPGVLPLLQHPTSFLCRHQADCSW